MSQAETLPLIAILNRVVEKHSLPPNVGILKDVNE